MSPTRSLRQLPHGQAARRASAYFLSVFSISYGAFCVVVGPRLLRGRTETAAQAESILFPLLVVGVFLTSVFLTWRYYGRCGLRGLFAGEKRWRRSPRWYAVVLLLCPSLTLAVTFTLSRLISPIYRPNTFLLGITFALMPGFLEEFGWTGFAYPHLRKSLSPFRAALLLGFLWGLWHAPVVDYLGAAAPHHRYWLPFFLAFIAIVCAVRVLIVWIYNHTASLPLAQLMHVSMTGSLVAFDPVRVSPAQEALWYAIYAALLWLIVLVWIRPRMNRRPLRTDN